MGGPGSGNLYSRYGTKPKVEGHLMIDVRRLHREGLLHNHCAYGWEWKAGNGKREADIWIRVGDGLVELIYTVTRGGVSKPMRYQIPLDYTPCNYGGYRTWFLCPGCGRGAAKLYLRGEHFLCRRCQGLVYESQSQDDLARAAARLKRATERLDNYNRPKGMHRLTYRRRLEELRDARAEWEATIDRRLAGYHTWNMRGLALGL